MSRNRNEPNRNGRCGMMTLVVRQTDVPNTAGATVWSGPQRRLHADDGFRASGRQTVSLRVPQLELGGGRQSRSQLAAAHPRPPGLSGQGFTMDETGRLLRQAQVDQQPVGRQRTRKLPFLHLLTRTLRSPSGRVKVPRLAESLAFQTLKIVRPHIALFQRTKKTNGK